VTFYAFITDDIPKFLITVFLFIPFNDWVFSLIYSIVVNFYAFSSEYYYFLVNYFITYPLYYLENIYLETVMALYAFLNNKSMRFLIRNIFKQPVDFIISQIKIGYSIITKWYNSKTLIYIRTMLFEMPIRLMVSNLIMFLVNVDLIF